MRCPIRYLGATFPHLRGTRCDLEGGHDGQRHAAMVAGVPLSWWTEEEKEVVRARKRARVEKEEKP